MNEHSNQIRNIIAMLFLASAVLSLCAVFIAFVIAFFLSQPSSITGKVSIVLGIPALASSAVFFYLSHSYMSRSKKRAKQERQADRDSREPGKLIQKQPQPKEAREE
jgi:membrane protein implicated in regulation of membrane protease activity